jgi:hypothetical protein
MVLISQFRFALIRVMRFELSAEAPDPKLVIQKARMALERLSAEAERLRKISELQSLKANPVAVSVDTLELLENTKNNHTENGKFGTLDEMMVLLRLMSANADSEPIAPVSPQDSKTATVE